MLTDILADRIASRNRLRDMNYLEWYKGHPPALSPSSVGGCMRQAYFQAFQGLPEHQEHVEKTHPFPPYVLSVMDSGVMYEADTERKLRDFYGDQMLSQYSVWSPYNGMMWRGSIDFVVPKRGRTNLTIDYTIVEHKATADHNFRIRDRLPYKHHLVQLMVYWHLVSRRNPQHGHECILMYRGWGQVAEYDVFMSDYTTEDYVRHPRISWEGFKNGKYESGEYEFDVAGTMEQLEQAVARHRRPDGYASPVEEYGCARKTKQGWYPSCPYFGVCWPDWPQEGPFDEQSGA